MEQNSTDNRIWERSASIGLREPGEREPDMAAAWEKLSAAMGQSEVHAVGSNGQRGSSWAALGALAAAGLVAVAIAYAPAEKEKSNTKTYTTTAGQRATLQLEDGSNVVLAPSTTIRVTGRHIALDGQAVFTVVPEQQNPFVVKAGNTDIKVLGTTFGVRKYTSDNDVDVTVAVGKVAVADAVLSAGDKARVGTTGTRVIHNADITSDLGWTSGKLVLNEITFRDAIPELERWYGIKIQADEELLSRVIRAKLQTESAQEAVSILSFTLRATAERKGSVTTFTHR